MAKLRIVITGGGTGGHIMPGLAVAEALKTADCQISFIGSQGGPEGRIVEAAGYPFFGIAAGKLRRYWSWQNGLDFFKVLIGFWQARRLLQRIRPAAVFAKGGYVSVPVAYAAAFLEIPVVAHESDVILGLANRLVSQKAALLCTGFPVQYYPTEFQPKAQFTGNPIRALFFKPLEPKRQLAPQFGLHLNRPIILFLGGSQGAMAINQLVFAMLPHCLTEWQIIHITGVSDIDEAMKHKDNLSPILSRRYIPYDFVTDQLPALMSLATVVVTRASANVLAELAYLGKPVIAMPLPSAAADHQTANAEILAAKGAAILLSQETTTVTVLIDQLRRLLADDRQRQQLGQSIRAFSSPEAPKLIAELIIKTAQNRVS